jgi:hypothetical protein
MQQVKFARVVIDDILQGLIDEIEFQHGTRVEREAQS